MYLGINNFTIEFDLCFSHIEVLTKCSPCMYGVENAIDISSIYKTPPRKISHIVKSHKKVSLSRLPYDNRLRTPGGCNNIEYLSTYLKHKSRDISFFRDLFFSCQIVLKFCTEHGSNNACHTQNTESDWANEMDVMDELDFARVELTHWGRVTHICVGNLIIIGSDNGLLPGRAPSHFLNQCWNIKL